MGLPYGEEIMIVGRTNHVDTVHKCDRRTNGQTDGQNYDNKTVLRIASHGKNSQEVTPQGTRQMRRVGFLGDFRPICRHISKTVHFRHKVTIGR